MRIAFLGTGDIGLPTLRYLLNHPRHTVTGVVCQPDKPSGRKLMLTPPATKVLALEHGIPVFQPQRLRNEVEMVRGIGADLIVVIAYGQILPQSVLDLPPLGCLNLHASILPHYRGASPVQAPILNGDSETGMTVMWMDAGLDTGDILLTDRLSIHAQETGGTLHDRLAELGPQSLDRALTLIEAGNAPRFPQDHAASSHTGKLDRSMGVLDWTQDAASLERRIRAFDPWPGTSTILRAGDQSRQIKVFPAIEMLPLSTGCAPAGSILSADATGVLVACGKGALRLQELQLEGRKRLPAREFLAGCQLSPGMLLG